MLTAAFTSDMPDLEGFIKELDLFDDNVNQALRTAMHTAGDMIGQAQKRLVLSKSKRLAAAISTSRVYTTKDGALGITSGYQAGAFQEDSTGFNPGLVGMVTEFGRPRSSRTKMEQTRNGKKYSVTIGKIQPYPHIRRGFDAVKDRAVQVLIDAYNAEFDMLGGGNQ